MSGTPMPWLLRKPFGQRCGARGNGKRRGNGRQAAVRQPATTLPVGSMDCARAKPLVVAFLYRRRGDLAVDTVRLVVRARGEVQRVDALTEEAVAERQTPQAVDLQWTAVVAGQPADPATGRDVIRVDR